MFEAKFVWMNGELVPWDQATVHVGTHGLHYGTGVFEGIRAYATPRGPAVLRLADHMRRLYDSARLCGLELPYAIEDLTAAVWDTIEANELDTCYVRPIAYRGFGQLGLTPFGCPVDVSILAWPWGAYFSEEAQAEGITASISSYRKYSANVMLPAAKATGQYINSVYAKVEALERGAADAILLNDSGFVSEGTGENVFVVRDGAVATPPLSDGILPGITRATVIDICRQLDIPLRERHVLRSDLYTADEVFFTGTAVEVTPVRKVDDHVIGGRGPVTERIQDAFFATIRGDDTPWSSFMEYRQR